MNPKFRKKYGACTIVLLIMIFFNPLSAKAFSPILGPPLPGAAGEMHRVPMSPYDLWLNPKIAEDLQLTDEQVAEIKEADFTYREKVQTLRTELERLNLKMEKAFSMAPADEGIVNQYAKEIADLMGKIFILNIESRLAFEKLLTAEQIKMLRSPHQPPRFGKRGAPLHEGPSKEAGPWPH
ncbi:MAG: Spy/CpxP family protein refolding chaperone [Deltaproteobacteria bacterium]|nr:Spy/CpxP family protein refolding chaperone [Deltaproteobacteria bacterium]